MHHRMTTHIASLAMIGYALQAGCLFGSSSRGDDGDDGDDGGGQAADIAAWDKLVAELDPRRTEYLGPRAQSLAPVGGLVYWLDHSNFDLSLHRRDAGSGARIDYRFSIGEGDLYNFRASATVIATAEAGNPPIYHAYDASAPAQELGTTTAPAQEGTEWSAYEVLGGVVYIMDASVAGQTQLLRWVPGEAPVAQFTLESAGATVGIFQDFTIDDTRMVFVESGRIWALDLATRRATWLMNRSAIAGPVDVRSDGVMFASADGVFLYDDSRRALVDVTDKIKANPFRISATFAAAALPAPGLHDFARWKDHVIYIGNEGVFSYDLVRDRIVPIVLSPHRADLRIDYRYPVALDSGTLFVTGLTSTSGATGADGPTYRIELAAILD